MANNDKRSAGSAANLSSSRRQAWRANQSKRTHEQLYDASDYIRNAIEAEVDASPFAKMWIGVGLQIAATVIEQMANEILVEDIVKGNNNA